MKNVISLFLAVGLAMVFLTGCSTTKPNTYAEYHQVIVVVTADQKFVVGNEKVGVDEFFDKTDFNRQSPEVIFIVDKKSKVLESTMMELVKIFQDKGYVVKMAPESKYAGIVDKISQR